ncbi:MAG: RidA family protein [Planctomycetota bacterium]
MKGEQTRRGFLGAMGFGVPMGLLAGEGISGASEPTPKPARRNISSIPNAIVPLAVVSGNYVFVSGVVGNKPGQRELAGDDAGSQGQQAIENLKKSLEIAGSKLEQVVKFNCYLSDEKDSVFFNKVYNEAFPSDGPALTTVIVKGLTFKGAKVQVDCIATMG